MKHILYEEFVKRHNVHQLHFEDAVLLGPDGIDEIKDKVKRFFAKLEGEDLGLNMTSKIDGCLHPDTLIKTTEGDISFSEIISNRNNHKYYGYGKDKNGNIKEVELKFPRISTGSHKDWYSIVFENDGYVIATQNHPFSVKGVFIETEKLQVNDDVDTL